MTDKEKEDSAEVIDLDRERLLKDYEDSVKMFDTACGLVASCQEMYASFNEDSIPPSVVKVRLEAVDALIKAKSHIEKMGDRLWAEVIQPVVDEKQREREQI